jgi:hypothetical protein
MTPDIIVAAGTLAVGLSAMGGVAAWIARLVRAPLEIEVERAKDDIVDLAADLATSQTEADKRFNSLELKVQRNADDIVGLGKADVEHSVAIRHLEETLRTGLASLDKRLDDVIEGLRELRQDRRT